MNTKAIEICLAIARAGGTPYFVGGMVRDLLLGRKCTDFDIEVFGLMQRQLEDVLQITCLKIDFVGAQYGIYKADGIDVGIPRRDKGHGKGAEVEVAPDMSIEEAAKRRDITINSMYLNPFTMEIIDPFDGRGSLKHKVIRHVNEDTFQEDPLRPIRAARFAATLNFDVDYNTLVHCRNSDIEKIKGLPKERIMGELTKVLMEAPVPSRFFRELIAMNLMSSVFPEVFDGRLVEQGKRYHPEGNVLNHTLLALDVIPVAERSLDVMLAILLHDLGKSLVPNEVDGDVIHFYGHAEELANAKAALARLTKDIGITDSVLNLIYYHMQPYQLKENFTKKQVRKLAAKVDMRKLLKVHKADRLGRGQLEDENATKKLATADQILAVFEEIEGEILPIMQGRDLINAGFTPGNHFGNILKELYEYQLDEQFFDVAGGTKLALTLFGNLKGGKA